MLSFRRVDVLIWVVWSYLAVVALTNWALMARPKRLQRTARLAVLIPARNEAANLRLLLPAVVGQADEVCVCDDSSDDGTADVARELGARVVVAEPLPEGWTGKNHACDTLARAVQNSGTDWWVFLDADTRPGPEFGSSLRSLFAEFGDRYPVMTGFPKMLPGRGIEPGYLFWVPWLLLATIPFGVIHRSGKSHVRFTNGQFVAWKAERYSEVRPHAAMRGEVLEDVQIGRMLARLGVPVLVVQAASFLSVRMYDDLPSAIRGMSKNAYWVTGSVPGAIVLGLLLLALAASPVSGLGCLAAMLASVLAVRQMVRMPWWVVPLAPLSIAAAGVTQWLGLIAARRGVVWKNRRYGG